MGKTRFFLHLEGMGEGCDYTVGCNEKLLGLHATNIVDAKAEALEELGFHDGSLDWEPEPGEVLRADILVVEKIVDMDVAGLRSKRQAIEAKELEFQRVRKEREEYERLQRKYG